MKLNVIESGENCFVVESIQNGNIYYIDENGNVISDEKILKIDTIDELEKFRDSVNNGNNYSGWYIYLNNDLKIYENSSWIPIGYYNDENDNAYFNGIFDGRDHNIMLNINNEDGMYQGMFAYNLGTIKNVEISEDSNIKAKGTVGFIAAFNKGIIQNCTNNGNIDCSNTNIGGIVGKNDGDVLECENYAKIKNNANTNGGIIGWNLENGVVKRCSNNGEIISAGTNIGGIIGANSGKSVRECFNSNIIHGNLIVGGIVGNNSGKEIWNCYNTGNIIADKSHSGGIVGYSSPGTIISQCYNIGKIDGGDMLGAVGGWISGNLDSNFYLIGTANSPCNKVDEIDGIIGCLAEYMTSNSFLLSLNKSDNVYIINEKNNGYPIFNWQ